MLKKGKCLLDLKQNLVIIGETYGCLLDLREYCAYERRALTAIKSIGFLSIT